MSNKELGERVKAARVRAGLTQTELGRHLGIDKGKISLVENGHRDLSAREALAVAKATGISVDRLLGEDAADKRDPDLAGFGCVCPKAA